MGLVSKVKRALGGWNRAKKYKTELARAESTIDHLYQLNRLVADDRVDLASYVSTTLALMESSDNSGFTYEHTQQIIDRVQYISRVCDDPHYTRLIVKKVLKPNAQAKPALDALSKLYAYAVKHEKNPLQIRAYVKSELRDLQYE